MKTTVVKGSIKKYSYAVDVAETFVRGYLAGRHDGNAMEKALDAAVLYIKPRSEDEEALLRTLVLGRFQK